MGSAGWAAQTDTTILNPVIYQKLRVARFNSALWQSYDLYEIRLTQKEAMLKQKYFTGSMPLLTPNHNLKTCGGPEAFTSTAIKKCGSGGQEHYIQKTHYKFPYPVETRE